jgi:hypothetical protein
LRIDDAGGFACRAEAPADLVLINRKAAPARDDVHADDFPLHRAAIVKHRAQIVVDREALTHAANRAGRGAARFPDTVRSG